MIGRAHRFHGRNGLRHVYVHGQTVRGPLISLKYLAGKPGFGYRAAVVVSKKVSKSAFVRNRIRRRVYEVLRQSALSALDYDVVVSIFSEQIATISAMRLTKMLNDQLVQAGIGPSKAKKDH